MQQLWSQHRQRPALARGENCRYSGVSVLVRQCPRKRLATLKWLTKITLRPAQRQPGPVRMNR